GGGRNFLARQVGGGGCGEGGTHQVAFGSRHHIEFPDNPARLRFKRVHTSLHALVVATSVTNEDEAVPGYRCGRHSLAPFWVRNRALPHPLTCFDVIGQHPSVLGTAKQKPVQIRSAAIDRQNIVGVALMCAPILGTILWVE